jgi:hypothetical protein
MKLAIPIDALHESSSIDEMSSSPTDLSGS